MVFNPSLLLAYVVAALLLVSGGAYFGYQYSDGQHAKQEAEFKDAFIAGVRQQADADREEAVARARREALAEERAKTVKSKGINDAQIKSNTRCNRDDESHSLLLDAISAANGAETGPGGMPKAVPKRTSTNGQDRSRNTGLGVRVD